MNKLTKAGVVIASAGVFVGGWAASQASASSSVQNTASGKAVSGYSAAAAAAAAPRVFAVVNADGTKLRGKGFTTVTKLGTGVYEVLFNRNITTCSWVGTVGLGGFSGSTGAGEITITGRAGTNNGLFVTTFNGTGGPADEPFHADVICS